jgi:hypothetical protein
MRNFQRHLEQRVAETMLESVEKAHDEKGRVEAAALADRLAQMSVLAGAHSGQTITMLAERAVNTKIAPLQQSIRKLTRQQQQHTPVPQSRAPASAGYSLSAHASHRHGTHRPTDARKPRHVPAHGAKRAHDRKHGGSSSISVPITSAGRTAPSLRRQHSNVDREQQSVSGPAQRQASHTPSPHPSDRSTAPPSTKTGAKRHADATPSHPKNAKGGDRPQQHRQQPKTPAPSAARQNKKARSGTQDHAGDTQ